MRPIEAVVWALIEANVKQTPVCSWPQHKNESVHVLDAHDTPVYRISVSKTVPKLRLYGLKSDERWHQLMFVEMSDPKQWEIFLNRVKKIPKAPQKSERQAHRRRR